MASVRHVVDPAVNSSRHVQAMEYRPGSILDMDEVKGTGGIPLKSLPLLELLDEEVSARSVNPRLPEDKAPT